MTKKTIKENSRFDRTGERTQKELCNNISEDLYEALKDIPLFPIGSCLGVPHGLLEYDKSEREAILEAMLLVEERIIAPVLSDLQSDSPESGI